MEIRTKERILQVALNLFSQYGYNASSMNDIAKELGITKTALYRHYDSKQALFDCIVKRMEELDQERIVQYQMPEGKYAQMANDYKSMPLEKIIAYSEALFTHWTEDDFSSKFRKVLELERYHSPQMHALYQKYLGQGPVDEMTELFAELLKMYHYESQDAKQVALAFYGPIFLLIHLYDGVTDKGNIYTLLREHIIRFSKQQGFHQN
ncbi:TetR/AcrR family transcriptional regulator [Anaerosporobacter faecicola]|uniref:TetR/AcrR family transcriptional regulator n=1 Tax=Anaerosporobacter faecicola TaxID=2718714 RepID=UPI00143A5A2B|nr:TetR/AcrR family transcriptional regulator [Anaerosporobacter faecicola]